MRPAALLLAGAALLLCACPAQTAVVVPIQFVPVGTGDSLLYPLYANTSLDGVFVTGLGFGTPPQQLQLLIDTGSGITHVAGKGCGSSCGLQLSEDAGYDAAASSTARAVPCGDECSCKQCSCQYTAAGGQCVYYLGYGELGKRGFA